MRDTVQRNSFTRQTIAQASCANCDILATNVGIMRKAYKARRTTSARRGLRRLHLQGSPYAPDDIDPWLVTLLPEDPRTAPAGALCRLRGLEVFFPEEK